MVVNHNVTPQLKAFTIFVMVMQKKWFFDTYFIFQGCSKKKNSKNVVKNGKLLWLIDSLIEIYKQSTNVHL